MTDVEPAVFVDMDEPDQSRFGEMTVLVVDDSTTIVKMVEMILQKEGYRVTCAHTGEEALCAIDFVVPDLVLCDIEMPGMSGIELCGLLSKDLRMKDVPILMLTASDTKENTYASFDQGASDFISKPVDAREVLARVKVHIHLKKMLERERDLTLELRAALQQRSDLAEARRKFLRIAAHDLRSPLSAVTYAEETIKELVETYVPAEHRKEFSDALEVLPMYTGQVYGILDRFLEEKKTLSGTSDTSEVSKDLDDLFDFLRDSWTEIAGAKGIELVVEEAGSFPLKSIAPVLQILGNFISNAIKFSPANTRVVMKIQTLEDGTWRVAVIDQGPGISLEEREVLFTEGGKTSNRPTGNETSHGIGLFSTREVATQIGAEVGVEFPEEGGSVFWLKFK